MTVNTGDMLMVSQRYGLKNSRVVSINSKEESMSNFITLSSVFEQLTSKTAIAIYVVVLASLLIIISITTIFDVRRKMEFKRRHKMEKQEEIESKRKSRFPELLEIDRVHKKFTPEVSTKDLTLTAFCENFRDYLANELKLYYSLPELRKFVASLGVSKTMILQGMSGTGKTSLAVAFGKYINVPSTIVPIQPMWKERSDLLGYYNEFTGRFNETVILQKLYEAAYSDKIFIVVLDEVNIARVEYYFSEFLSLLELPSTSSRQLVVTAAGAPGDPKNMDRGKIILPDNVWFLGTANNDDSTFAISDKVYDRAMIMNLDNRAEPFEGQSGASSVNMSATRFAKLVAQALDDYQLSEEAKAKIKELDDYLIATFQVTFGNRILMQINKYIPILIACGGTENEALDDILAKKTLRKLEAKNPVYIKSKSQELIAKIDSIFGQDVMVNCIQFINMLANNG